MYDIIKSYCPLDLCDGSGEVEIGHFDNIEVRKCPCSVSIYDMDDDSDRA